MAIEFGSSVNGAAASVLAARTPSVRKSETQSLEQERGQVTNEPRVGFGEGTISAVGVAAITVDRNLESAREIVPTLDELSAEARARAEAVREDAASSARPRLERGTSESLRNESASRAQSLGSEERTGESDHSNSVRAEQAETLQTIPTASARNVASVVSLVVPEPAASFDVFG